MFLTVLLEGGISLPRGSAGLCSWGKGMWVESSQTWCVMLTYSFCRFTLAASELAGWEKWCHFSDCGMV
jgi:hypothetical protein